MQACLIEEKIVLESKLQQAVEEASCVSLTWQAKLTEKEAYIEQVKASHQVIALLLRAPARHHNFELCK